MIMKTEIEGIGKIAEKISKIRKVKAVYLFGSYASGKQHAQSDIDLCVIGELNEKDESRIFGFANDKLDISTFNRLPIYIKMRVLKEGNPLLIKDKEYIQKLKFNTLREYLDFKPAINKFARETLKCTI